MDRRSAITQIADRLQFLDGQGQLRKLDSLGLIDFVLELEKTFEIAIPAESLTEEHFRSIDSIAQLVQGLKP